MRRRSPSRRSGLSLLEVLISTVIFLFAIAAIGHLVNLGSQAALAARFKQEGVIICESKLGEFVTGEQSFQSGGGEQEFPKDSPWEGWRWSASSSQVTTSTNAAALWRVEVTATRDVQFGFPVKVVMSRMIIDPNNRGSTLDQEPVTADQQTGS
jgi:Tfp pilus assembly protein PilV